MLRSSMTLTNFLNKGLEVLHFEFRTTFCHGMHDWIAHPGLSSIRLDQLEDGPRRNVDILEEFRCCSMKNFSIRMSDELQLGDGRLHHFLRRHPLLTTLDLRSSC